MAATAASRSPPTWRRSCARSSRTPASPGDYHTALSYQDRLFPLHQALFVETNLSPTKYALSLLGKLVDEARLPMVPVSEKTKETVRAAMVHAGLLN